MQLVDINNDILGWFWKTGNGYIKLQWPHHRHIISSKERNIWFNLIIWLFIYLFFAGQAITNYSCRHIWQSEVNDMNYMVMPTPHHTNWVLFMIAGPTARVQWLLDQVKKKKRKIIVAVNSSIDNKEYMFRYSEKCLHTCFTWSLYAWYNFCTLVLVQKYPSKYLHYHIELNRVFISMTIFRSLISIQKRCKCRSSVKCRV